MAVSNTTIGCICGALQGVVVSGSGVVKCLVDLVAEALGAGGSLAVAGLSSWLNLVEGGWAGLQILRTSNAF